MDTSATYREIVKEVIRSYAKLRPSHGQIRLETVFDEEQERYGLMQVGWDRGARVRGNLIYVTLQGHEVVIEYDGIEHGIIDDLVRLGIPRKQIVLAFLPMPKQTEPNGLKSHLLPEAA